MTASSSSAAAEPPQALPISQALRPDGRRVKIHPIETEGRFTRLQKWLYPALIAFYAALPWIKIGGHPAVWLDIDQRRFFLFGLTFNSSDFYLAFFVLSGIGFSLVVISAMAGRLWCGYACPQTVFLEAVFRRIERLVEGKARERSARDHGPWTGGRVARLVVKHALFLAAALIISHLFLAYFARPGDVLAMVKAPPWENWGVFLFVMTMSALLYFNYAWFREQLCIVICPYGRLQSVLADQDTLVVGYDALRGEPRGRKKQESGAGDCVDCRMCVQACPTGIDIRAGLQMECIGCGHCVDACDTVMVKIGRSKGLVRYDSMSGLEHRPRRFWRGRVYGYIVAGLAGVVALSIGLSIRHSFESNIFRSQAAPRERVGDSVVHRFVVQVASKSSEPQSYALEVSAPASAQVIFPTTSVSLQPFESRHLTLTVVVPFAQSTAHDRIKVTTTEVQSATKRDASIPL